VYANLQVTYEVHEWGDIECACQWGADAAGACVECYQSSSDRKSGVIKAVVEIVSCQMVPRKSTKSSETIDRQRDSKWRMKMSSKTYMSLCAALSTLVRVLSGKVFSTWTSGLVGVLDVLGRLLGSKTRGLTRSLNDHHDIEIKLERRAGNGHLVRVWKPP
jgi:hypothetical protein